MTLEDVSINWADALADIKNRKLILSNLSAALESALASGVLGEHITPESARNGDGAPATQVITGLPAGAFMGKSLRASILLFLSVNKRHVSAAEITQALKDGGAESTASDFDSVVATTLGQLKAKGDVLRFKDGWAFAEHLLFARISAGCDHIRLHAESPAYV